MILSVSRRTDIPAFYGEWFYNRLKAGEILVRNPMNSHKITKLIVNPDTVECIVFWTKDATNFLKYIEPIKKMGYKFYFQYTITSYSQDIEQNVPQKKEVIKSFAELSKIIGTDKVIWRYDPILLNEKYTVEYHKKYFVNLCQRLKDYTQKCVISFVDSYSFLNEIFRKNKIYPISGNEIFDIASSFKSMTNEYGLTLATCAEKINLSSLGIEHNKCIDDELISKIIGKNLKYKRTQPQRTECRCMDSRDVGKYDSCQHNCIYCYAAKKGSLKEYDVNSPMLCDSLNGDEVITIYDKKLNFMEESQPMLFKI